MFFVYVLCIRILGAMEANTALILVVALSFGAYTFVQKMALNHIPLEVVFICVTAVYGLFGLVYLYWHKHKIASSMTFSRQQKNAILILLIASLLLSFIPYLLYMHALKHTDSYIVAVVLLTAPLITMLLGTIVLKEKVSYLSMLGALLIIAGVCMLYLHSHRKMNL